MATRKVSVASGKTAGSAAARVRNRARKVNLALQGGGSHGAFTWGVLDALLDDGRIEFDAITGASAGAMNAAVLSHGWLADPHDPRAGARAALGDFWRAVSIPSGMTGQQTDGSVNGLGAAFMDAAGFGELARAYALDRHPAVLAFDLLTRIASPYQFNPFNANPLRDVLDGQIDFERLRASAPFRLRICATHVRTGRPRIFTERELTTDMLLASSCLPFFFQAPEIDGEHYWDGGYSGNPPLFPLRACSTVKDIVLVQINPLVRDGLPDAASEIVDRLNEISFNTSLMLEMRSIEFVQRLLDEQRVDPRRYRRIYMHMISAEEQLRAFGASSKFNAGWNFLTRLRDIGRDAARQWIDENFTAIGKRPTVDIARTFL